MYTVQGYRTGLPSIYQDIKFQMIYVHCTGLPCMTALYVPRYKFQMIYVHCTRLPYWTAFNVPRYHVSNDLCTLYRATVHDCLVCTKISSFKWSMYTVQGYRTGLPSIYQDIKFQMIYVHCAWLPYWTAFFVPRYQVSNYLCTLYRATVHDCLVCTKISSFK